MRIVFSILFLLMSLDSFAWRDITVEEKRCNDLSNAYKYSAQEHSWKCEAIEKCLKVRRTCNQKLEDQTSCENFNSCVQTNNYGCTYGWKFFFAARKKVCRLTVKPGLGRNCLGYAEVEGGVLVSDLEFKCAVAKKRYHDFREEHIKAYYDYKQALDSGKCKGDSSNLRIQDKCAAAFESVE